MPPVNDTTILQWLEDFLTDDTNSPSQDDWETGVVRDLDDEFRNIKSVVRSWSTPYTNKVWQVVEKPNTIQFVQHATYGFVVKVEFVNIVSRLEPLQILKATRGVHTYYFVVTNAVMEGSSTLIQVQPLPVQFTTSWYYLVGNELRASFSIAEPPFTGPFRAYLAASPPVTGKQGLAIFDSSGVMSHGYCDQIDDDSISTYFTSAALFGQGKITSPTQVKQTWALNVYPNISGVLGGGSPPYQPDEFVDQIYLGTNPSLFAKTSQSGTAIVNGDATVGPYALSNFPRAEPDANYTLLLQIKATTIPTPTTQQLTAHIAAQTASNFSLTFGGAIPLGQSVTLDWMTMR